MNHVDHSPKLVLGQAAHVLDLHAVPKAADAVVVMAHVLFLVAHNLVVLWVRKQALNSDRNLHTACTKVAVERRRQSTAASEVFIASNDHPR